MGQNFFYTHFNLKFRQIVVAYVQKGKRNQGALFGGDKVDNICHWKAQHRKNNKIHVDITFVFTT